jgi:hypothetical protein
MISSFAALKKSTIVRIGLFMVALILVGGGLSNGPLAAVFDVDRSDDAVISACTGAANDCTLRGAMTAANGNGEADTINIPATITTIDLLSSSLPTVTTEMVIIGPGADVLNIRSSDGTFGQLIRVETGGDLELSGVTISNGFGSFDVSVIGELSSNYGGGVYITGGQAALDNCTISGNKGAYGGGISSYGDSSLYLSNSTVSGNQARYLGGGVSVENMADMVNCTISGNSVHEGKGGGVWAQAWNPTDTVRISHSTIAGNSAASGGGIYDEISKTLIRNCIMADNTGGDIGGVIVFADYNLIEDLSTAMYTGTTTHHITGVDPRLGPLTYNGGDTQTQALSPGSPAINAGICTDTEDAQVTMDQRGRARPVGTACDIGAFELKSGAKTGPMELLLLNN